MIANQCFTGVGDDNLHMVHPVCTNVIKPIQIAENYQLPFDYPLIVCWKEVSFNETFRPAPIHYSILKVGRSLRIYQLNVEGMSRAKGEIIAKTTRKHKVDVLLLQETHIGDAINDTRLHINGFQLVAAVYHAKYGIATYVRCNLLNVSIISESSLNDVFIATIKVGDLTIMNVYKPPQVAWPTPALPTHSHPDVTAGDFNSHHSSWGYNTNDEVGERLENWASTCGRYLLHDAKQPGPFHSARWNTDYNPDLCFLSRDHENHLLQASRKILQYFPHSQHRPALIHVGVQLPVITSKPQAQWNFRKANWEGYAKAVDGYISDLAAIAKNYKGFCNILKKAATKHIPRGYCKFYTPCWLPETEELFKKFEASGDLEVATCLLDSLNNGKQ